MQRNYTVYLGSAWTESFAESIVVVQNTADYLQERGYGDLHTLDKKGQITNKKPEKTTLQSNLEVIKTGLGFPLKCMRDLSNYYAAQSSLDLLLHSNVQRFKQDAYVAAKLRMMSSESSLAWLGGYNTHSLFLPIMSDNPHLIDFLIQRRHEVDGEYERKFTRVFFLKNTLLALAGDWAELRERAEQFLNEPKRVKSDGKRIPDHEFYLALSNQDVAGMETALNKLLEPRMAKWAVYNNEWFDFYLQMQVCLYGKIASIHGFELNIDSPMAPKELITYQPLETYEDPYAFMQEFDYDKPIAEWVHLWEERTAEANRQQPKGFFARLFRR